jgi:L-asparaginase
MAARPRIRFLYTGGTLGMLRDPALGLVPSHIGEDVSPYLRGLEEEVDMDARVICNLDSSDMTPAHWETIGRAIVEDREKYDGFVVVHGTDTMAYTAAALSFLLQGLDRPVVLTGAQRPIAFVRTDARSNLIHSALCAARPIPEVGLFFGRWLFRGNRTTKTSIESYEAMESPNLPPLVEVGVHMIDHEPPLPWHGPFAYVPGFCEEIAVIHVVPGSRPWLLDAAVAGGARGVLLRGFGAGNVPQRGWPTAIRAATDAGVVVVIESQCLRGEVELAAYEPGRAALAAGAVGAGVMTTEAAIVKLMHLLGQGLPPEVVRARYGVAIAGEL